MIIPAALRRVLAHRTVTAAASVTVLLAALTFAVLVATASAISDVGTRKALAAAPATSTALVFTAAPSADGTAGDAEIRAAAHRMLRPYPVRIEKALVSAQLKVDGPGGPAAAGLVVAPGYAGHVRILSGTPLIRDGDILIPDALARQTGVAVGDRLTMARALWGSTGTEQHRVAGIYVPADDDPVFWGAVRHDLDNQTGQFAPVVFGTPSLLAPRDNLASLAQDVWFAAPDLRTATRSGVDAAVLRILRAEDGDVGAAVFHGSTPTVNSLSAMSRLPMLMDSVEHAEVAGMSGFLIIATLLAVLAAFAVALTLKLLREHRAEETRLVRARGADLRRLVAAAGGEALLVSAPALVAAPFATGPLCRWLAGLPGLGDLPAPASPAVAGTMVSVLIFGFCLGVQGLAALAESRDPVARGNGRSARAAAFQRAGVDGALAVLALVGYLQMRHYKSPVTAGRGALGIDPVLVVAPAVTAAALATLTLRLLPFAAGLADRRIGGARGLPGALGGWQVSRRAARHAGTVLLLVLALAVGAMTVTGTAMRARSADDRALFQVGADLRVTGAALPQEVLRSTYSGLPGVRSATPLAIGGADLGRVQPTLVGVNAADVAAGDLRLRPDLAGGDLSRAVAPLAAGARGWGAPLPGRPASLRFQVTVTGADFPATLILTFRDRDGQPLVRTLSLPTVPNQPTAEEVPLLPVGGEGRALAYPVVLDAVEVRYPIQVARRAVLGVDISALTTGPAGEKVALPDGQPWHGLVDPLDVDLSGQGFQDTDDCEHDHGQTVALWPGFCDVTQPAPDHLTFRVATGRLAWADEPVLFTVGFRAGPAPGDGAALDRVPAIPVLATDSLLNDADVHLHAVGDRGQLKIGAITETVQVVGRLRAVPGLDPEEKALVVDRRTLAEVLNLDGAEEDWHTSWLLDAGDHVGAAAVAGIAANTEFGSVTSREAVASGLRDGAFSGSQTALLLIAAATAPFFAMVGFAVSAVTALRNRRREFAVLRAIGARPRQLSTALWVEQAALALVAVVVGLGIGVGTAAVTVPLVTVDDSGATVFPGVRVVLPWLEGALVAAGTAALVVLVVMTAARALGRVDLARMLRAGEEA